MCLIRVRDTLCRNGPDLRIPGLDLNGKRLFSLYVASAYSCLGCIRGAPV